MNIGSHIGQYRIVGKLGSGGMGTVFLGEHTLIGRRAAIKTLLPTLSVNHELVARFVNEARATSAISDPGVIQIFDFGYHTDGTAYIVMELLQGEPLSARIERCGRLSLRETLRIARQGAGSLAAAHARNVIHRDLKPENVFLVRDDEAQGGERTKILDFGICKLAGHGVSSLTGAGTMIGTPIYMSPEQCRGAGPIDHRSDIYAFGCMLFHMLTGRPPFLGDAPGELIVAHLRDQPPSPSELVQVPAAVDALVGRCLAKSPADRFQSMIELQAAIGSLSVQLYRQAITPDPAVPSLATGSRPLPIAAPAGTEVGVVSAPAGHEVATPMPSTIMFEPPRRAGWGAAFVIGLAISGVFGLVTWSMLIINEPAKAAPEARNPTAATADEPCAPASSRSRCLQITRAQD